MTHPSPTIIRAVELDAAPGSRDLLSSREWIVTNGLGGYASGTLAGVITRKYHGILIAALPAPLGRIVMWSHVFESLRFGDDRMVSLGAAKTGEGEASGMIAESLGQFRLEDGLPIWTYHVGELVIEKRIVLPHLQNTVHVNYRVSGSGERPRLELRPAFHFRHHEEEVDLALDEPYKFSAVNDRYEITSASGRFPPLRMRLCGTESPFSIAPLQVTGVAYQTELARGYAHQGELWSPGFFGIDLVDKTIFSLIGSTESWEVAEVLSPAEVLASEQERRIRLLEDADPEARDGMGAELVLASDQFIIVPGGRLEDATRAHAAGEEVRTMIAGYHWFTDWGRDTMISLEGLTLLTGRCLEAGYILRTFAYYVRDGLIPNMFPEGCKEGLYHTADATLWYFHALSRYLKKSGDRITLRLLLPTLVDIIEHHLRGTKFNIHVDPDDGLLVQGAEGYQLTWMDAKMGDWVVTPRRGKAVEINALWFNALKLLEGWLSKSGERDSARRYAEHAKRAHDSFNRRFWFEKGGYLYDVVDSVPVGDDSSCRPNQLLAISLQNPVLEAPRWKSVLDVVQQELLTPFGLRSLSPKSPDYKRTYHGDLRTRDAAYHQGTVWSWLIGPFIDAWLKVYPDQRQKARKFLDHFPAHLGEAGLGTISEVFDAEEPHVPRGCIAQAWSVAEVLRCWVKTG